MINQLETGEFEALLDTLDEHLLQQNSGSTNRLYQLLLEGKKGARGHQLEISSLLLQKASQNSSLFSKGQRAKLHEGFKAREKLEALQEEAERRQAARYDEEIEQLRLEALNAQNLRDEAATRQMQAQNSSAHNLRESALRRELALREEKELAAAIAASLESESKPVQPAASTAPKVAEIRFPSQKDDFDLTANKSSQKAANPKKQPKKQKQKKQVQKAALAKEVSLNEALVQQPVAQQSVHNTGKPKKSRGGQLVSTKPDRADCGKSQGVKQAAQQGGMVLQDTQTCNKSAVSQSNTNNTQLPSNKSKQQGAVNLDAEIEELSQAKAAAVDQEDFRLAADLKDQIAELSALKSKQQGTMQACTELETQLKELELSKKEAVACEDYRKVRLIKSA